MRILFASNLYPPDVVGGYERLCFEVASALAERGHEISVLTSNYGGGQAEFPGQRIERSLQLLAGQTIYDPFTGSADDRDAINKKNVAKLRSAYAAFSPDLIYSWNLFFLDRSFLETLSSLGAPAAVMLTDNWLANMFYPQFVASFFRDHVFGTARFLAPKPRRSSWLQRMFRFDAGPGSPQPGAQRLDVAAVYGSEFMRGYYAAAGFDFASEAVIHNGVEQKQYAALSFPDRSQPVVSGEFRILFAGRLVDLKGADTAVRAVCRLGSSLLGRVRVRLTIAGDDQDVDYVRSLMVLIEAGVGGVAIERRPSVPEKALFDLFSQHDIYVFPSLYEPFSLTLIHALACGVPTIASDAGGNVEIIEDGISGLIYPKGDAVELARRIERLACDPKLRERLSAGGRKAAKAFSFESVITRTEDLFDDLRTR